MQSVYLIIYDLREPDRDYNTLYEAIRSLSDDLQHPLQSTWFVYNPSGNSLEIYNKLKVCIGENDHFIVVNMNNPADREGWMPKSFWKWIKSKESTGENL